MEDAKRIKFKGKSLHKGELWEGYYVYSGYEDKHYIVQNAIKTGEPNGSISFAHFAEIDHETLQLVKDSRCDVFVCPNGCNKGHIELSDGYKECKKCAYIDKNDQPTTPN